jgi:pimeloyl-ACP methyl ester carboxylesterase
MYNFIIAVLLTILASCSKEDQLPTIDPSPTFTLTNDEETMPVWVDGKADSKTILFVVHGGPGSDALDFRNYQNGKGFLKIEEQFLVVYWQQRASGQSSGADKLSLFTIDQYAKDLDKVIDEIKVRYPNKKIALFGHSWGGMLTSTYLKDATKRAKVDAWIDAAGATDGTTLFESTRSDLQTEADYRISVDDNASYWQDIKRQLQLAVTNVNALAYQSVDKISEVTTKVNNADFKFSSRAIKSNQALFPSILATDNSLSLANFEKPVLMLWGKYDFAVSKKIRDKALIHLTKAQVTNVLFDKSGHYMMFHEPDLFSSTVNNFLQKL